jgi:cytochrome c553
LLRLPRDTRHQNSIPRGLQRSKNQNEAYLAAALRGYRNGERYNSTMKALASSLTEKEVLDIAAYYAKSDAQSGASGK